MTPRENQTVTDAMNAGVRESVRARVTVTGRVQGVCFRWATQAEATRLGVVGWVRNRSDGAVEGVFEGPQAVVDALIRWCHGGPAAATVLNVAVEWESATGEFGGFEITR